MTVTVTGSTTASPTVSTRLCGVAAGTRLLTPAGYRPVETLSPKDMVRILLRGEPRFEPIARIGRRDVILSRRRGSELPVRIRKHAIADEVPDRDVYLAPEHAIYLDGKLIRIGDLVNGGSIVRVKSWRSITYWGILLDQHNVVLADNLPIESLLPVNASPFGMAFDRPLPSSAPPDGVASEGIDIEAEVRAIANRLSALMVKHSVRVEFGVQSQLKTRFPLEPFRIILTRMLEYAIAASPGSRLLLTGVGRPNGQQITVTFAHARPDAEIHCANLRSIQEVAALHGARVDVDAVPDFGIMLSFRVIE
jgi:hypothetical protein